MTYRRAWPSDVWHWRAACTSWPTDLTTEEQTGLPKSGRLCAGCTKLDLESRFDLRLADDSAAAAFSALKDGRLYA